MESGTGLCPVAGFVIGAEPSGLPQSCKLLGEALLCDYGH
jgi:hypothetical protein